MAQVFVTGSFNVDHVWRVAELPAPGATLSGSYATGPGGKGFNQAVAARRAGAITHFVCALGEDLGAQLARALCEGDEIALHAATSDAPTGTAGIYVDAHGRNSIVIGAGANAALTPNFVSQHLRDIATGDVAVAQLESPLDAIACALHTAREAAATTLLNPAPANIVIDDGLLALADILTPNETEFAALLARHAQQTVSADALAGLPDDLLHTYCRSLLPQGTVIITLGASGCFVSHSEHSYRGDAQAFYKVPAAPVTPVDTTGAGDAFNGALAASMAQRPALAFIEHIRFATHYAGRSTEHTGAALAMPHLLAY